MHRAALSRSLSLATKNAASIPPVASTFRRSAHALAKRKAPQSSVLHGRIDSPINIELTPEQFYSDEELNDFYQNLLSSQPDSVAQPSSASTVAPPNSSLSIDAAPTDDTISNLERRFTHTYDHEELSTSVLAQMGFTYLANQTPDLDSLQPYQSLLLRLTKIIARTEASYNASFGAALAGPSSGATLPRRPPVPFALVSYREWFDVVRHCINAGDMDATQHSFALMIKSGLRPPTTFYISVLERLAEEARVSEVEGFISFMKNQLVPIGEEVIHLQTKAYIRSRRLTDACTVLHSYEASYEALSESSVPNTLVSLPSQKTYTLVIASLLAQDQSHSRSIAWDLFAHMRYVAHPVPDARLYATMLRACAYAPESQSERAVDLWTEMCVDNKVAPTRDAYNALILACARASGTDKNGASHAHEAFRYAREMLEAFRAGAGHLRPDTQTFGALLESVKRTGDLTRARWILAELVGAYTSDPQGAADLAPNEDIMAHIFQVYASYQPPFVRRDVRVKSGSDLNHLDPVHTPTQSEPGAASSSTKSSVPVVEDNGSRDTPQSHAEVVAEASILFERILHDTDPTFQSSNPDTPPFHRVKLTSHLLNSYLSVHFAHSSIEKSRAVFEDIFSASVSSRDGAPVRKNARTYLLTIRRCAQTASPKSHRFEGDRSLSFARALWVEWEASGLQNDPSLSPRTIERIWSAMIRILSLSGNLEEAMALVRSFARTYPPQSLLKAGTAPTPDHRPLARSDSVVYGVHDRAHLINTKPPALSTSTSIKSQSTSTHESHSDSISQSPLPSSAQDSSPPVPREAPPRPLVQMVSPTLVADPSVPPWLSFNDIEALHQRLLPLQRWGDVEFLTWLTRAYGGGVRRRRETVLVGLGGKRREKTAKTGGTR